ncbi:MAG: L,D-transpeptidase family protein [Planctomycetes bacterium]|nr:L,D-transpeptidase family protein [Planctomycetota bacterium]
MLPPEGALSAPPAVAAPSAPIAPEPAIHAAPQPDTVSTPPVQPTPPASPFVAPETPVVRDSGSQTPPAPAVHRGGDKLEIELARSLVSDPGRFCDAVEGRRDLPTARRDLALAVGKALAGKLDEARRLAESLQKDPLVRASESEFLDRLIGGRPTVAQFASATTESPLVWAALLVVESRAAEALAADGKSREAAQTYSEILLDYVRAPWSPDANVLRRWSEGLNKSQQKYRWNRAADWPSISVKVEPGDSLIALRKRLLKDHPELLLCTGQIERSNGIRGTTLQPGQTLKIPTDRARMLVDLDARWAFYIVGNEVAQAWEVGVGKEGGTRQGQYTVGDKKEEPMWFRPGQAPVPYGSPENPLGTRWIAWLDADGATTGLGFHGTNQPESIGKDESQGCIRMRNADVEELFEILPRGAVIQVQP